jgi:hypothetical protein
MINYEVVVDKPHLEEDWCLYDEKVIKVLKHKTTAIIAARDETHLKQKLEERYGKFRILSVKVIDLY